MRQIRLMKFTAETGLIKTGAKAPEDLFGYALEHDEEPKTIKVYTADEEKQAKKDLAAHKCVCREIQGFAGAFYEVEAYALEYAELDEDGDPLSFDSWDYEPAEVE